VKVPHPVSANQVHAGGHPALTVRGSYLASPWSIASRSVSPRSRPSLT